MSGCVRLALKRRLVLSGDSVEGKLTLHGMHDVVLGSWTTLELPYRNNERRRSCIPVMANYEVVRRRHGGFYQRYRQKFGHEHCWQVNHPGENQCGERGDILFHRGNTSSDTLGCILIGRRVTVVKEGHGYLNLSYSTSAYKEFYAVLSACTDEDTPIPMSVFAPNLKVLTADDVGGYHDKEVDRENL